MVINLPSEVVTISEVYDDGTRTVVEPDASVVVMDLADVAVTSVGIVLTRLAETITVETLGKCQHNPTKACMATHTTPLLVTGLSEGCTTTVEVDCAGGEVAAWLEGWTVVVVVDG